MSNNERQTMPPSKADECTREFEIYIHERGENQARWVRLMTLLADTFGQPESEAA